MNTILGLDPIQFMIVCGVLFLIGYVGTEIVKRKGGK